MSLNESAERRKKNSEGVNNEIYPDVIIIMPCKQDNSENMSLSSQIVVIAESAN